MLISVNSPSRFLRTHQVCPGLSRCVRLCVQPRVCECIGVPQATCKLRNPSRTAAVNEMRFQFFLTCSSAGCWAERTEVHKAASLGQASQLEELIQGGASVNMVAVDSITPLHEACLHGQAKCVQLLLEAGAQVSHRRSNVIYSRSNCRSNK